MKWKAVICLLLIALLVSFSMCGCGSYLRMMEDEIFEERIGSFFDALDNQDATMLKALFSQAVIDSDEDLDLQIDKLFSVYPNAKTEILYDGLASSGYSRENGKYKSMVRAMVPVVCDGTFFWAFLELIYEDDYSEDNIGLNKVYIYTIDEFYAARCTFEEEGSFPYPDETGLVVFSELKLEQQLRPIHGNPYAFTPVDREIHISDVEAFFETSTALEQFVETFGQANAQSNLCSYYEIVDADGTVKYLELGIHKGIIRYANIVSDFEFVRVVLEESPSKSGNPQNVISQIGTKYIPWLHGDAV